MWRPSRRSASCGHRDDAVRLCVLALPVAIISSGFAQDGRRDFVVAWSLMFASRCWRTRCQEVPKVHAVAAHDLPPNVEVISERRTVQGDLLVGGRQVRLRARIGRVSDQGLLRCGASARRHGQRGRGHRDPVAMPAAEILPVRISTGCDQPIRTSPGASGQRAGDQAMRKLQDDDRLDDVQSGVVGALALVGRAGRRTDAGRAGRRRGRGPAAGTDLDIEIAPHSIVQELDAARQWRRAAAARRGSGG